jgi:hypothetical protein
LLFVVAVTGPMASESSRLPGCSVRAAPRSGVIVTVPGVTGDGQAIRREAHLVGEEPYR